MVSALGQVGAAQTGLAGARPLRGDLMSGGRPHSAPSGPGGGLGVERGEGGLLVAEVCAAPPPSGSPGLGLLLMPVPLAPGQLSERPPPPWGPRAWRPGLCPVLGVSWPVGFQI